MTDRLSHIFPNFQMHQPPRNLDELLRDFNHHQINSKNLDNTIDSNLWAKRFRDYLNKRQLDEEIALQFLIFTQPFQCKADQLREQNNNSRKQNLRKELEDIFLMACELFFNEESETLLCLSNHVLFDSICETRERLKILKNGPLTDKEIDLLLKARKDSSVLQSGVDPKFMKFLSQAGVSPLACLLSIL